MAKKTNKVTKPPKSPKTTTPKNKKSCAKSCTKKSCDQISPAPQKCWISRVWTGFVRLLFG